MKTRTKWIVGGCITTLVAIAAFFTFTKPSSPSGRYAAASPPVVTGDFYYELSGGKVYFVDYENSGVTKRDEAGTYFKTQDGWFYTIPSFTNSMGHAVVVSPIKIECSWMGLSFPDSSGKAEFWRRRLIAGKRPEWMTLYLPWKLQ